MSSESGKGAESHVQAIRKHRRGPRGQPEPHIPQAPAGGSTRVPRPGGDPRPEPETGPGREGAVHHPGGAHRGVLPLCLCARRALPHSAEYVYRNGSVHHAPPVAGHGLFPKVHRGERPAGDAGCPAVPKRRQLRLGPGERRLLHAPHHPRGGQPHPQRRGSGHGGLFPAVLGAGPGGDPGLAG